jgi:ABC-type multidrug transport system ATPase subunit
VHATSGEVEITIFDETSSRKLSSDKLTSFVGFVPQEDILDRELTIRELFTFNALMRLKNLKTKEEADFIVDQVLSDLSIQNVADAVIGGGENLAANISGGQLKRVNIGCELVALSRPSILLLDEPTAGLDASIAYELVETLEGFAAKGITIFMSLQQPRVEIFEKIANLFLMNSNGSIVFEGFFILFFIFCFIITAAYCL